MPRFFFDIDDGALRTQGCEGFDFCDADAAREELVGALAQMAADQLPDGPNRDFSGTLRDADGKALFNATLSLRSGWVS